MKNLFFIYDDAKMEFAAYMILLKMMETFSH